MRTSGNPLPAKLTAPSAAGLVPRARLYDLLDAPPRARLVWVSAPCGSGKTSLFAGYLADRERVGLWCRLDESDGDAETFLRLLRVAAQAHGRPPRATALAAVSGDAARRRALESVFAELPAGFAIVLDDYHAVAPDAALHAVLPLVVESLPRGATLFVASRGGPPATLARIEASPGFSRIGGRTLAFTPDEATALARTVGVDGVDAAAALALASGGWPAGLVLLARGMAAGVPLPATGGSLPKEILDYFAREVFERMPAALRGLLLRTAIVPRVTPDLAGVLTGHPEPERMLEELHDSNLFTERKPGNAPVYEYHPLFRRFLVARAGEVLGPAEMRMIRRRAAHALEQRGDPDGAAPLFAETQAWEDLYRLVREHAPVLAGDGRAAMLRKWIERLPEAALAQRPWAIFWLAWCRLAAREPGSAEGFARAHAAFVRDGDVEGAFAACAWSLRASSSRKVADRWLGEAERLASLHPVFDDPQLEARVIFHFRRAPQVPFRHPLFTRWRERATTLARTLASPGTRLQMASFALEQYLVHGESDAVGALVAEHRHLVGEPGLRPGEALHFLLCEAEHQLATGADIAAARMLERLEALVAETGFVQDHAAVARLAFRLALARGDLEAARSWKDVLARLARGAPQHDGPRLVGVAYLALAEGDSDSALAAARAAAASTPLTPTLEPERAACLANVYLERGEPGMALAEVAPALEIVRRERLPAMESSLLLLAAAAHIHQGDRSAALPALIEGLRIGARLGCVPRIPLALPRFVAELAALALARGVEPRSAERLIARLNLVPPPDAPAAWPWTIRVRTLGRFSVGSRLAGDTNGGKPARKPLELLKFIIAAGTREVSAGRAVAALWPDLDGDAGKKAFDITLHRLRKSLGTDAAIHLEGGKLSLDERLVWVDALAFERFAAAAESLEHSGEPGAERALHEALLLYRGHFLATDDDLAWVAPHRERLRERFARLVHAAGARWEAIGDWSRAERLYREALMLEPTAEAIHVRLMRALFETGRAVEALDAYRRCREMLSIVLGARPSPRTEALIERIRAQSTA